MKKSKQFIVRQENIFDDMYRMILFCKEQYAGHLKFLNYVNDKQEYKHNRKIKVLLEKVLDIMHKDIEALENH